MHLKYQDTYLLIASGLIYLLLATGLWSWLGTGALVPLLTVLIVGLGALQLHLFRTRELQDTHLLRQVQALFSLYNLLEFRAQAPWFTGWAATPELAARLYQLVRDEEPELVVELGSGASSVVIAAALEQNGTGQLISIEQNEEFAARTRTELERQSLSRRARVEVAPIKKITVNGTECLWYDRDRIPNAGPIDVLVVDGPHRELQKMARFPALPLLFDLLAPDATIVLDDADRKDERRAVRKWLETFSGLEAEFIPTSKGLAIIRRTAARRPSTPVRALKE